MTRNGNAKHKALNGKALVVRDRKGRLTVGYYISDSVWGYRQWIARDLPHARRICKRLGVTQVSGGLLTLDRSLNTTRMSRTQRAIMHTLVTNNAWITQSKERGTELWTAESGRFARINAATLRVLVRNGWVKIERYEGPWSLPRGERCDYYIVATQGVAAVRAQQAEFHTKHALRMK